jgi:hypothetical protein
MTGRIKAASISNMHNWSDSLAPFIELLKQFETS